MEYSLFFGGPCLLVGRVVVGIVDYSVSVAKSIFVCRVNHDRAVRYTIQTGLSALGQLSKIKTAPGNRRGTQRIAMNKTVLLL